MGMNSEGNTKNYTLEDRVKYQSPPPPLQTLNRISSVSICFHITQSKNVMLYKGWAPNLLIILYLHFSLSFALSLPLYISLSLSLSNPSVSFNIRLETITFLKTVSSSQLGCGSGSFRWIRKWIYMKIQILIPPKSKIIFQINSKVLIV